MKRLLTLLALAGAGAVWAETPPTDAQALAATNTLPVVTLSAPPTAGDVNEIRRRRAVYSGSVVQVIKTHRVMDLINPFAPAAAGSGVGNTALDPITGKAVGLKFIAVSY